MFRMSLPVGAGALPIKRNETVLVNVSWALWPEKYLQLIKQNDELLMLIFSIPTQPLNEVVKTYCQWIVGSGRRKHGWQNVEG